MPSNPKAARLRAALTARAERELGEGATALDFLVFHLSGGGFLKDLTDGLAEELSEPVTRTLLSHVAHRLADDAPERLRAARREGAGGLVEEAVEIIDTAPIDSREALQRAKARADIRTWVAERANPAEYGATTKLTGQVALRVAHLDALRQRSVAATTTVTAPQEEPVSAATALLALPAAP